MGSCCSFAAPDQSEDVRPAAGLTAGRSQEIAKEIQGEATCESQLVASEYGLELKVVCFYWSCCLDSFRHRKEWERCGFYTVFFHKGTLVA